jgi:hypothetical protein
MAETDNTPDISMDPDALYREEVITDQKIGTIRIMTPIKSDGSTDENRDTLYYGQSQMMTPAGALPLNFEIEASNIKEAAEKFGDAAKVAMQETVERLKEMQREAASQIVVPGAEGGMGGMGGLGGAGGPGGKIQLR